MGSGDGGTAREEKEERGGRKLRAEACTDELRTTVGLRAR